MTIRFFRRVTLLPGLRLNLSKSGASLSIGTPRGPSEDRTSGPGGRTRAALVAAAGTVLAAPEARLTVSARVHAPLRAMSTH